MILYPTETTYALGVNPFDHVQMELLFELKERDAKKYVSWLIRDVEMFRQFGELSLKAEALVEAFLPGPLMLVVPARASVPLYARAEDGTLGFRISSDPVAQQLLCEHAHPLTATSANKSGMRTLGTPTEILAQFGEDAKHITRVIDDGPRRGAPSTIVRVIGDTFEILREGAITSEKIRNIFHGFTFLQKNSSEA